MLATPAARADRHERLGLCCLPLPSGCPFTADRRPAIVPVQPVTGIEDDCVSVDFNLLNFYALSRADIRCGRRTAPAVSSRSPHTDGVLPQGESQMSDDTRDVGRISNQSTSVQTVQT